MDLNPLLFRLNIFHEEQKLLTAKLLIENINRKENISSLRDVEFKVFSQWGDDGIIQWLINNIDIPNETFIEFGVENYRESNTRFLMMNNNWSGLVLDGSANHVNAITNSEYYWKYDLEARAAFVDCDNINTLISSRLFDREVGILHIDIDGNDYWVWESINVIDPIIVIMEYNSVFGHTRPITIPYNRNFNRTSSHHSNLYFGASLPALNHLANRKGYAFIGCNSAGNNAYFARCDKLNSSVKEIDLHDGFVDSRFRESRDQNGNLTYISGDKRIEAIKGLPVINVTNNQTESI